MHLTSLVFRQVFKMNRDDYDVTRRFEDLSNQADRKGIVLFSDFLNMNEINLLLQCKDVLATRVTLFGGYEGAERQMVAFQPDALYYNWEFPISCIQYSTRNSPRIYLIGMCWGLLCILVLSAA